MAAITEINGQRMLLVGPSDDRLETVRDFTDLIGDGMGEGTQLIGIPADRIGDDFYRLRTGLAGEVLQKLVNYHIKLAIIGDVSRWTAESHAFRDLVIELERGTDVLIVPDEATLASRLERVAAR